MSGIATLAMVNLDCGNPPALAEFYHQVLGWEVTDSQDEHHPALTDPDGQPFCLCAKPS